MKTKCNHCNQEYEVESKYDGNLIECPECKESFFVEKLDNILVKKSTKGIFKNNPALVGAACCLFFAIVLNFISNFFFFLWGPLYLVVFVLGIVAIIQQKPLKGISFIVASLLLPLTICLVNIFWVGAVLSDAIKKKNQRNFYESSAKSKKIKMDFFNTDPFANSSSTKKQIKKSKPEQRQKKTQKNLKPINKPPIVLIAPVSHKAPKVSIVSSKKIVKCLVFKNLSRKNKNYYVKFSRILARSKNEANWKIVIKFVMDNKKEKEIIVKLNDVFKFRKDKYKLCYIEVPKWVINYKKDHRFKGKKKSFRVLHRNDRIYLRNVNSREGAYIKFNKKWRYSDISATLIDSYTRKAYIIQNKKILTLENDNNYEVKLPHTEKTTHATLIDIKGEKYTVTKFSGKSFSSGEKNSHRLVNTTEIGKPVYSPKPKPKAITENLATEKNNTLPAPSKPLFPIKLAAYVLHSRYLFSATEQAKGWHYGKEVTVSGVVNLDNIKRVTRRDLVDSHLTGKYFIPMLGGKINCIIQSLPNEIALAKAKGYKYLVMKFKGIVKKSNRYKEAFINKAQYVSSRVISYSLTWQKNRISAQNLIYKSKLLVNCQQLKSSCRLDLYRDGRMGRLQCEMGADPEAYAMEIHWLRKLYKKYRNLRVTFSFPKGAGGISNNLSNVAILGWRRSVKHKRRL